MIVTARVERSRTRGSLLALACAAIAIATATQTVAAHHDRYARISAGEMNGNGAVAAFFRGASVDGKRVFFETTEKLVISDSDTRFDIYERNGGLTSRVSTGLTGGNGDFNSVWMGNSADGTRVFFATVEQLVAADTDIVADIYQRSANATTLISAGQINGNGNANASFAGASADGTRVFFVTDEQLVSGDTDHSSDLYQRWGGVTSRVSVGQINGNGANSATFAGVSAGGGRTWFVTSESLVAADTDFFQDIYERSNNQTYLVSRGAINGNGSFGAEFAGASSDGSRVYFRTFEKLAATDTDAERDVYQFSGGNVQQITVGAINGNGAFEATFRGSSAGGGRVFFTTAEQLVSGDTDAGIDLYQREAGVTTKLSPGNGGNTVVFRGASSDGLKVFFETNEGVLGSDTDASTDVYQQASGVTTRISVGNGPNAASFGGASADGSRVFYTTAEAISTDDDDTRIDIYESEGGVTRVVSIGDGAFDVTFRRCSIDGLAVIFDTLEPVLPTDKDAASDIYGAYAEP